MKVKVPLLEDVAVAARVGVRVNVGPNDGAGVRVSVATGEVGVRVDVGQDDCVGVRVAVDAGRVTVGVLVLVLIETTNCGGFPPSREEKRISSLVSPTNTRLNVPLPATRAVTSYST